jgi:hypothetical protein
VHFSNQCQRTTEYLKVTTIRHIEFKMSHIQLAIEIIGILSIKNAFIIKKIINKIY